MILASGSCASDNVPIGDREVPLWAESAPTRVASGRTAVRAKAAIL